MALPLHAFLIHVGHYNNSNLLIKALLGSQDTNATTAAPSSADDILHPVTDGEAPVSGDKHTTYNVDDLDQEGQDPITALVNRQQDRLNVILEENSRNVVLVDRLALLSHGVLVGEDGPGSHAVHSRHNGEVVLELVEVVRGGVDSAIEGVDERGVEGTVGQLRDDVRKVKV